MRLMFSSKAQDNISALVNEQYDFLTSDNKKVTELKQMLHLEHFAREFGTIAVKGRRGLGLTWLAELFFLSPKYNPSLIITAKSIQTSFIQRQLYNFTIQKDMVQKIKDWVFPVYLLKEYPSFVLPKIGETNFKLCILDNASYFKQEEIDLVYAILSPRVTMFTFLG